MIRIVIFASGSGTNAEEIMKTFAADRQVEVAAIFCNNTKAGVLERAAKYKVPSVVFGKVEFEKSSFMDELSRFAPDYIVLAGFLWKIPYFLIKEFKDRILNIHPSLLPKYGGKGMYGSHVHEAVISAKEMISGITIHLVNEVYDDGKIIHQSTCKVSTEDTPESLAEKIHVLEHEHFPKVIKNYVLNRQ